MLPSFNEKEHPTKIEAVNAKKAISDQEDIQRSFKLQSHNYEFEKCSSILSCWFQFSILF